MSDYVALKYVRITETCIAPRGLGDVLKKMVVGHEYGGVGGQIVMVLLSQKSRGG